MILALDQQPWPAAFWAVGGPVIGFFGMRVLRTFSTPLAEWYRGRNDGRSRLDRMATLLMEGKTESEEFQRLSAEDTFLACVAVPPLFGLFYGIPLGAIGGALCALDRDLGIPASVTAALGMIIGYVYLSGIAALTCACVVSLDGALPFRVRMVRRGLLLISPLLMIPAVLHCLHSVMRRRPST